MGRGRNPLHPGIHCDCRSCTNRRDRARSDRDDSGGTMNSTAFEDRERRDGSGKRDILFNTPGDGSKHGHVVEKTNPDGTTEYIHARDVEGNVYHDKK